MAKVRSDIDPTMFEFVQQVVERFSGEVVRIVDAPKRKRKPEEKQDNGTRTDSGNHRAAAGGK